MCDFGTGDNNKLNWVLEDKQELIDIIETIYRGAKKGRGLVVSPKGTFRLPSSSVPMRQTRVADCNRRLLHQIQILAFQRRRGITMQRRKPGGEQQARRGMDLHGEFLGRPKSVQGWSRRSSVSPLKPTMLMLFLSSSRNVVILQLLPRYADSPSPPLPFIKKEGRR